MTDLGFLNTLDERPEVEPAQVLIYDDSVAVPKETIRKAVYVLHLTKFQPHPIPSENVYQVMKTAGAFKLHSYISEVDINQLKEDSPHLFI